MNTQIQLITAEAHREGAYLNSKTHEAVLFLSNKRGKDSVFTSLGSRPTHKVLLPKLVKEKLLTEQHAPTLYDQGAWGVGEIIFYSLRNSEDKDPPSKYFRLGNFTDQIRMAGGDLIRQHLKTLKRKPDTKLLIDMSEIGSCVHSWYTDISGKHKNSPVPLSLPLLVSAFVEGLHLGSYQYELYKSSNDKKNNPKTTTKAVTVVLLFSATDKKQLPPSLFNRSRIAAEGVCRARDLVNAPPNDLHSEAFVREARKLATSLKVNCQVYGKSQLKKMKMNALLAVNAGSHHEAKLLVLDNRYPQGGNTQTILMVGKGVLFDSGGLSLKPASAMNGMKMDMAGGAAVLSAFESLVKLQAKARIVAIIPLTDNMTGENAMKVGDILHTHSGKTVEVLNTDAEGRLILCDALSYGIKTYHPNYIVDLATLTGACLVALGTYYAGLFTPDDDLSDTLLQSSRDSDEPLWRLPSDNFYTKEIQSEIADLKNIGSSYGGAITAAKFLEQFIPEKYRSQWAHLDIAPVMDYPQTKGYQVKGASGFGVRLLIDFVEKVIALNRKSSKS